jgi:hypothetical protein
MTDIDPLPELTDVQFDNLDTLLTKRGCIAFLWCIEDVQDIRPDLDPDQAMEVLKRCRRRYDAGLGLNWEILDYHADDLFPDPDYGEEGGL